MLQTNPCIQNKAAAMETSAKDEQPRSISVIIPAYNEAERILPTLRAIHRFLRSAGTPFEIIVVDDGSLDNTNTLVRDETTRLPHIKVITNYPNQGKGAALQKGVAEARHDLILISDADLSSPISCLYNLLEPIQKGGYDIVIGSRWLPESNIQMRQSPHREMMGKIFNLMVRTIVMDDFRDTQCGFKLFKAEVAKKIFSQITTPGFAFDVEVLIIAKKNGYRIKETPIEWANSPKTEVRLIRDSMAMFIDLLKIRQKHIGIRCRPKQTPPLKAPQKPTH